MIAELTAKLHFDTSEFDRPRKESSMQIIKARLRATAATPSQQAQGACPSCNGSCSLKEMQYQEQGEVTIDHLCEDCGAKWLVTLKPNHVDHYHVTACDICGNADVPIVVTDFGNVCNPCRIIRRHLPDYAAGNACTICAEPDSQMLVSGEPMCSACYRLHSNEGRIS